MDMLELGQEVVRLRQARGWTQSELSRLSGVGRVTIAKLESGTLPELGFRKVLQILNVLGMDLRVVPQNYAPTLDDLRRERERATS